MRSGSTATSTRDGDSENRAWWSPTRARVQPTPEEIAAAKAAEEEAAAKAAEAARQAEQARIDEERRIKAEREAEEKAYQALEAQFVQELGITEEYLQEARSDQTMKSTAEHMVRTLRVNPPLCIGSPSACCCTGRYH